MTRKEKREAAVKRRSEYALQILDHIKKQFAIHNETLNAVDSLVKATQDADFIVAQMIKAHPQEASMIREAVSNVCRVMEEGLR